MTEIDSWKHSDLVLGAGGTALGETELCFQRSNKEKMPSKGLRGANIGVKFPTTV